MQKEYEVMTIDNIDYIILKEVVNKGTTYLYLSNVDDEEDNLIRKSSDEDKDLYVPLESEEEFELACLLLFKNVTKKEQ